MCECTSHGDRRAALAAAHGTPRRFPEADALRLLGLRDQVHPRDAYAHLYRDPAAADAWLAANAEHYGHPALGAATIEGGVVGVLDLRPVLTRNGIGPTDPAEADNWIPGRTP